jgi:hypothetical protein
METWKIVQSVLLAAIAVAGAMIAWGQFRASQVRLQLDLFERRYPTFAALKTLFGHIVRHGDVSLEAITEFDMGTVEADFLYGRAVTDYLKIVRDKAFDLHRVRLCVAEPNHPDRMAAIQQSTEIMKWVLAQYEAARDVFRPYLRLDTHSVRGPMAFRLKRSVD